MEVASFFKGGTMLLRLFQFNFSRHTTRAHPLFRVHLRAEGSCDSLGARVQMNDLGRSMLQPPPVSSLCAPVTLWLDSAPFLPNHSRFSIRQGAPNVANAT